MAVDRVVAQVGRAADEPARERRAGCSRRPARTGCCQSISAACSAQKRVAVVDRAAVEVGVAVLRSCVHLGRLRGSWSRQRHHGRLRERRAARVAALARLAVGRDLAPGLGEDIALEQTFDQIDLVADRIVAPDLLLHRRRRAAAVQADHRVPAALVRGGQVLDQARRLDPLVVRHVRIGAQHVGELGGGLRVVVFVGAGQRDDQPARDVVGDPVHLVDLVGEQSLPMFENTGSGITVVEPGSALA